MKAPTRSAIVFLVAWLALCALTLRWCAQPSEWNVAHDAAVKITLDALDAYRKERGRYPRDIHDLQPTHLPAPAPFQPGVELRYAINEAGDSCWVAYNTQHTFMPSDTFIEHACGSRERIVLEYGEAKTTPRPGVTMLP